MEPELERKSPPSGADRSATEGKGHRMENRLNAGVETVRQETTEEYGPTAFLG